MQKKKKKKRKKKFSTDLWNITTALIRPNSAHPHAADPMEDMGDEEKDAQLSPQERAERSESHYKRQPTTGSSGGKRTLVTVLKDQQQEKLRKQDHAKTTGASKIFTWTAFAGLTLSFRPLRILYYKPSRTNFFAALPFLPYTPHWQVSSKFVGDDATKK